MATTLRNVRDYLNTLTDSQLDQDAVLLGNIDENYPTGNLSVSELGEDFYYSEDGCFPKSALSESEFQEYIEEQGGRVQWTADQVFFHLEV